MRRALLREKYLFECECDVCLLEGKALERSEARQSRLAAIHKELPACPPDRLLPLVDEQIVLMREEGVPLVWAKAGMCAALQCV